MPLKRLDKAHDRFMRATRYRVHAGAAALAAIAGYVNVVMLGYYTVPVSHMSGAVSHLGLDIAVADVRDMLLVLSIVGGFFVGALLSGLVLRNTSFRVGRAYGTMLFVEAALLAGAMVLAWAKSGAAVPLAATACGLQNAMASNFRGLILRTTHVTGVVTDLGALLGNRLRGRQVQGWKFGLLLSILLAFLGGGVAGAYAWRWFDMTALAAAVSACVVLGGLALWLAPARRYAS